MDRHLYMNAAGYCHDLPGEQGNPLEVSLAYGMSIYANWLLPSDIAKSTVVIRKRMIEGYGCAPAGFASQGVATSSRFFIEGTTQKIVYPCTVPSPMPPQLHTWPVMHSKATHIVSLSKRTNMRTNASAE